VKYEDGNLRNNVQGDLRKITSYSDMDWFDLVEGDFKDDLCMYRC
jgi:hypothetical protein